MKISHSHVLRDINKTFRKNLIVLKKIDSICHVRRTDLEKIQTDLEKIPNCPRLSKIMEESLLIINKCECGTEKSNKT